MFRAILPSGSMELNFNQSEAGVFMYAQNGNQNSGGIAGEISSLGKAIGTLAAMVLTPVVFKHTSQALFHYFAGLIDRDYAEIATWIAGALEAYILYCTVSIVITVASIWAVTAMVERGWKR